MGAVCGKPDGNVDGGGPEARTDGKRAEPSTKARESADGFRNAPPGTPSSHRGSRRPSADGPSGRGGAPSGLGGERVGSSSCRSFGGTPGTPQGVQRPESDAQQENSGNSDAEEGTRHEDAQFRKNKKNVPDATEIWEKIPR